MQSHGVMHQNGYYVNGVSNGTSHPKIALLTEGSKIASYSYRNLDNIQQLLSKAYDLYIIHIKKDHWTYQGSDGCEIDVDKNDFSLNINGKKVKFDAVLNTIDDTGDNAYIQGYLEMLNIPTPNPRMLSTAIAFNKFYTSIIVSSLGIVDIPSVIQLRKGQTYDIQEMAKRFTFPVIVKPICGTNSYGVTKVDDVEKLDEIIKGTFKICSKIIIEQFIKGRELTCAAYRSSDSIKIIGITERISEIAEFFDYETKKQDKYQQITPADIPLDVAQKIKKVVEAIYVEFEYQGIVRGDFILEEGSNALYFLEVNSFPVLSKQSVVGLQAKAAGVSLREILCEIIDGCLEAKKACQTNGF